MDNPAPVPSELVRDASERLLRDGHVVIPGLLEPGETARLRADLERVMAEERERPFDPGDGPAHPQDEACARLHAQWWNCDAAEEARLLRRMRHQRAQEFGTDWPVPAAEASICFKHIPTLFDGGRSQRVFNLINKLPGFARMVEHPLVLAVMEGQLGRDCVLLDVSANAVGPRTGGGNLHMDSPLTDLPEPLPDYALSIQTAWMLTDFSAGNGATRAVTGSHRAGRRPDVAADPAREAVLEGPAGSVAIWLSQTWHRHGPNSTANTTRLGVIVQYGRAWMKPFVDLRTPLTAETAAHYSPRLRYMMGCSARAPVRG
ncbi:MAG: phytanoyl-CoA dioxygenase family protein [Geminicoccaceae bacterium]